MKPKTPPMIVGSTRWKVWKLLVRYHCADDCPHKGNCLNRENVTDEIMSLMGQAIKAEVERAYKKGWEERWEHEKFQLLGLIDSKLKP